MTDSKKLPLVLYRTERKVDYLNPATGSSEKRIQKGYCTGERNSFYEIYWEHVSNRYLIQERMVEKKKLHPGPYPIEILERSAGEESVDTRCLQILKNTLRRWGADNDRVENATVEKYLHH